MNPVEELLKSLYVMASLVEARDPYTGGHLWRVSQYSKILAAESGLPEKDVARIALGGFLHDLGKVGVTDAILNKPDRLTDEEYAVIKTHPEIGKRLLAEHPLAELASAAVHAHHETPDGRGYPLGLSGREIPVDAKIVGICDAFDAMTSNRPYRRGMPIKKALSIMEEHLGRQFDMNFGLKFIEIGRKGDLSGIAGYSEPGIPIQECPMCGPTIVVRKKNRQGDRVYCRHCGGEAEVTVENGKFGIAMTGKQGDAAALQPEADIDLIESLVRETAALVVRKKSGISRIFPFRRSA